MGCCPKACGIFQDLGSNPCPLLWHADSLPLSHRGKEKKARGWGFIRSASQSDFPLLKPVSSLFPQILAPIHRVYPEFHLRISFRESSLGCCWPRMVLRCSWSAGDVWSWPAYSLAGQRSPSLQAGRLKRASGTKSGSSVYTWPMGHWRGEQTGGCNISGVWKVWRQHQLWG